MHHVPSENDQYSAWVLFLSRTISIAIKGLPFNEQYSVSREPRKMLQSLYWMCSMRLIEHKVLI